MPATIDFEPETNANAAGTPVAIDFEEEKPSSSEIEFEPEEGFVHRAREFGAALDHRLLNDVREFGAAAGRYIFHGLEGLSLEQAKVLANPPAELTEPQGEEVVGVTKPVISGNIDLSNRPVIQNTDGSGSTVRSISVNVDGKEVLIPTTSHDGTGILSDEAAVAQYQRTGQHLGIFNNSTEATAYAKQLHEVEARRLAARDQAQPALDSASYWWKRAREADAQSKVDPMLAQTWDARLSRAGGEATIMGMEALVPGAGVPIMALNGAAAAEAEAKNAGKTDREAEGAAARSLIGLAIFGGANKVAALGVAKVLPHLVKEPGKLATFIGQFVGQDAANEVSSRAIAAWDAAANAKPGDKIAAATKALTNTTLETSTLNAVYAGIGAAHETGKVKEIPREAKVDFEPETGGKQFGPGQGRTVIADPSMVPRPDARTEVTPQSIEVRLNPGEMPIEGLTRDLPEPPISRDEWRRDPRIRPGYEGDQRYRYAATGPHEKAVNDFIDDQYDRYTRNWRESQVSQPTQPYAALFRADDSIPYLSKVRIEDQLKAAGVTEEQMAVMTTPEVQRLVATAEQPSNPVEPKLQPAPAVGGDPEVTSSRREPTATDIAEQEYRQQLVEEADQAQAEQGRELIEAVIRAGGFPSKDSPHRETWAGELSQLEEEARNPMRQEKIALNKLFRKDAPNVDELATRLRDEGFTVDRPDDLIDLATERVKSGRALYGTPEAAGRLFASGSAAPRNKQGTTAPAAPPHKTPVPLTQPTPGPAPTAAPAMQRAVAPLKSWWQQHTLGFRKLVAPQTIDRPARMVANIVRDYNGQLANRIIQADHALAEARADFDRTPVPRSWKYDPNKPLPRNYAFMAKSEKGGAGLTPNERALKDQLDKMFEQAVDEVHRVKPAALKSLIQDYFPHIWEDPAAAQRAFASIVGTRPLEGSKGFLKQRSLAYVEDGLKMGLRPISDNPIDLVLTKLHEVHKFVAAQDMLAEAKAIGARKFVYIFEKPPEGWTKVDDPTSAVHGPPFVTVPEAFDEQMKVKTIELLQKLGVPNERVAKLGGKRWGTASDAGTPPGRIRTKFAGPLSVYWHELGHVLQFRYGWIDQMLRGERIGGQSNIAIELRKLADLRAEGQPPNKSFKSYIRSKDEKAAVMLEAYLHAPQKMQSVAPVLYGRVKKFIAAHPELHAIEEIRPSLVLGTGKQQIDVGGMVTLGNYYMPEGAAQVFNNYLSPGLQRFGVIRSIRQSTNILSGLQLGFSAFHAGFTSIDAAVSQFALGLRYASEGKLGKAALKIATTPAAPVTNYLTGRKVQRAMLEPGYGSPEIQEIAQLAVKAGLRATVDPFWKTQVTRNMMRSLREGGVKGYAGTLLRAPFAASEQLMRPILEYLVPRQKLGVFAGMAQQHMERLGPNADIHAVRDAMARAADATEDRMGQMTYDNLFYNRMIRDMALLGFRAYGWTYGKYRSLFAGAADVIQTPGRIRAGEPVVTDRMAYLLALPMVAGAIGSVMNYMMTGQAPNDWKDALMPRTGRTDRNGNPQRLSLPTYIKDLLSDWHDFPNPKKMFLSFYHKLNPWLDVGVEVLNNADFYGTKIYNEDDPYWRQWTDTLRFVVKSATPFSVTSAMKLNETHPGLQEQALPFFGFVPAKAELTMTPAQSRAAELMRESLPRGSRTSEESERSQFISQLTRDARAADPEWQKRLQSAIVSQKILPEQLANFFNSLPFTPFQYQVRKLSAQDAMQVWDLANPVERQQLRAIVIEKIGGSETLPPTKKMEFLRVITAPRATQ